MSKPSRDNVVSSLNGWEADVNNNFIRLFDRPFPVFLHTGDETDLETAFPAATHEECVVMVNHSVVGVVPYMVDKNHPSGSEKWRILIDDPKIPTTQNSTGTLDWDDRMVVSNPGGNIEITLRPAGEMTGRTVTIKNVSVNTVTVRQNASLIDGVSTFVLSAQYEHVTIWSDGATYHVIASG